MHEVVGAFHADQWPGGTATHTDDWTRAKQVQRNLSKDRRTNRSGQQEAALSVHRPSRGNMVFQARNEVECAFATFKMNFYLEILSRPSYMLYIIN